MTFGFCGSSTIPALATGPLTEFAQEIFVDQERNIKKALERSVAGNTRLLRHSSLAIITRDASFSMGITAPPLRAFGCQFGFCGTPACPCQPWDVTVESKNSLSRLRLKCSRCKWVSVWLSAADIPFLNAVGPAHPNVFYAPFPLTNQQRLVFSVGQNQVNGSKKQRRA